RHCQAVPAARRRSLPGKFPAGRGESAARSDEPGSGAAWSCWFRLRPGKLGLAPVEEARARHQEGSAQEEGKGQEAEGADRQPDSHQWINVAPAYLAQPRLQQLIGEKQEDDSDQDSIVASTAAPSHGERNCKEDRKSTRLNSSHVKISYAVFCLKKKKK